MRAAQSEDGNVAEAKEKSGMGEPTIIKKYANRRLYNTATSSYVTLEHLSEMVRNGAEFVVLDAKTNDDITRSVLAQIIFEQESRTGQNLLPVQFLRRLINFYGHQMQGFLPAYLDMSMENFTKAQEGWRDQLRSTWGGQMPMDTFDKMTRQNMALFENALRMWSPFTQGASGMMPGAAARTAKTEDSDTGSDSLELMRKQLEAMQKQLDEISKK